MSGSGLNKDLFRLRWIEEGLFGPVPPPPIFLNLKVSVQAYFESKCSQPTFPMNIEKSEVENICVEFELFGVKLIEKCWKYLI